MFSLASNNTDKLGFVRNGVSSTLPCGFRFYPTDEELILHYLKKKVMSCPLPADIITELNVYNSDPWDLPGDSEEARYFFSTNETKYPNGKRSNRSTSSGYWKSTGTDKNIVVSDSEGNQLLGRRKTLVFYRGKFGCTSKTDWIMHEFRLADGSTSTSTSTVSPTKKIKLLENSDDVAAAVDNWVLCKISLNKKKKKKKGSKDAMDGGKTRPTVFNYDLNVTPASSSSSDPIGITHEEETATATSSSRSICNTTHASTDKP